MTSGVSPHILMSVCHSWCDIVSSDNWKKQRSRLLHQRRRAALYGAEGKYETEFLSCISVDSYARTIFMYKFC